MNFLNQDDTICALSTSAGMGAIALIRLSGKDAIGITEKTDALAIVISEENGKLSLIKNGELIAIKNSEILKSKLEIELQ